MRQKVVKKIQISSKSRRKTQILRKDHGENGYFFKVSRIKANYLRGSRKKCKFSPKSAIKIGSTLLARVKTLSVTDLNLKYMLIYTPMRKAQAKNKCQPDKSKILLSTDSNPTRRKKAEINSFRSKQ